MKKILNIAVFLMAVGAAFAFKPNAKHDSKVFGTKTVYYNNAGQTNCPNSLVCSDNNNGILCTTDVSVYYEVQATCSTISNFKWARPQ